MKLKNSRNKVDDLRELATPSPAPAHLTRLLKILDADIAGYPLDASPPDAVTAAHAAYLSAVARAMQKIEQVETAEQAAKQAAAHDVETGAQAFREGKAQPKVTQTKAAAGITDALVGCAAAEKPIEEAHDKLVDAIQKAWPSWRVEMVKAVAAARVNVTEATAAAAAAVATHRALSYAVGQLDTGVLGRDAELSRAVSAETRQGIEWYGSAGGTPTPLQNVLIPGVKYRGGDPMALDLAVVVETVAAAVAEAGKVQASDWVPPTDPRHADLLTQPLDPDQLWVKLAIMRKYGDVCVVCKRPGTEVAVEVVGAAWPWAMAHRSCRDKAPDPAEQKQAERLDAKAQKRAEREAKMQREGFPEDPQAGAWRKEKASAAAEDAHAAALGGLDDAGDANAAMIAKHHHIDD